MEISAFNSQKANIKKRRFSLEFQLFLMLYRRSHFETFGDGSISRLQFLSQEIPELTKLIDIPKKKHIFGIPIPEIV
jgi:hypothetical protein